MTWRLVYTRQAQKDARKLAASGLREKAQALLSVIQKDPFQNPPPYEKLVGDLAGLIRAASISSIASYTRCSNPSRS